MSPRTANPAKLIYIRIAIAIVSWIHGVGAVQIVNMKRAIGLNMSKINVTNCPQHADSTMWGIWIDGRDSLKGANAYGEGYGPLFTQALQMIYDTPLEKGIDVGIFLKIQEHLVGEGRWRTYHNPVCGEVQTCQKSALPAARVEEIMSNVTVLDWSTSKCSQASQLPEEYIKIIGLLFAKYSVALRSEPPVEVALNKIGSLLQDLAFLHPLGDKNGRSRLLLLQYLLRQQGIACGTMMYNNNKNIYFDTVPEFVDKIIHGIAMYNDAWNSGFVVDPWGASDAAQRVLYSRAFSHPWDAELEACWARKVGAGAVGTVPILRHD